jgi:hypothetical protein
MKVQSYRLFITNFFYTVNILITGITRSMTAMTKGLCTGGGFVRTNGLIDY